MSMLVFWVVTPRGTPTLGRNSLPVQDADDMQEPSAGKAKARVTKHEHFKAAAIHNPLNQYEL
jgi:hypothetical protein